MAKKKPPLRDRLAAGLGIGPKLEYEGPQVGDGHSRAKVEKSLPGMEISESWDKAVAIPEPEIDEETGQPFFNSMAVDLEPMDGVTNFAPMKPVKSSVDSPKQYDRLGNLIDAPRAEATRQQEAAKRREGERIAKVIDKRFGDGTTGEWTPEGLVIGGSDG